MHLLKHYYKLFYGIHYWNSTPKKHMENFSANHSCIGQIALFLKMWNIWLEYMQLFLWTPFCWSWSILQNVGKSREKIQIQAQKLCHKQYKLKEKMEKWSWSILSISMNWKFFVQTPILLFQIFWNHDPFSYTGQIRFTFATFLVILH